MANTFLDAYNKRFASPNTQAIPQTTPQPTTQETSNSFLNSYYTKFPKQTSVFGGTTPTTAPETPTTSQELPKQNLFQKIGELITPKPDSIGGTLLENIRTQLDPTNPNSWVYKSSGVGGNTPGLIYQLGERQKMMEGAGIDITSGIKNPIVKQAVAIPENLLNVVTMNSFLRAGGQTTADIKSGEIKKPQVMAADMANIALDFLTLMTLGATGNQIKEITNLARPEFWPTVVKSAITGLKYGTAFGGLGGVSSGREITSIKDYALNLIINTSVGGGVGLIIGAGTAGITYGLNKAFNPNYSRNLTVVTPDELEGMVNKYGNPNVPTTKAQTDFLDLVDKLRSANKEILIDKRILEPSWWDKVLNPNANTQWSIEFKVLDQPGGKVSTGVQTVSGETGLVTSGGGKVTPPTPVAQNVPVVPPVTTTTKGGIIKANTEAKKNYDIQQFKKNPVVAHLPYIEGNPYVKLTPEQALQLKDEVTAIETPTSKNTNQMLHISQAKGFVGKTPTTFAKLASQSTIAKNAFLKAGLITQAEITRASKVPKSISTPQQPKPVEIKPKVVSVPRTQLPVGEGEKKPLRLEERVRSLEGRIRTNLDQVSQETIDRLGVTNYNSMTNKDQMTKAAEYVVNNQEDAMKVLQGDLEPPKGLLKNSIFVAMVNNTELPLDLQTKLAGLTSKRYGQEIEILKEINKHSPTRYMGDVIKVRADAIQKKYNKPVEQVAKDEVTKIKKEIKAPTKYDWQTFIDSIEC